MPRFHSFNGVRDFNMIIKPKVRGFICTTTHPVGCEANVRRQIAYTQAKGTIENGPKKVLVIGASTGYGLASRIATAFGSGAATIGVFFEKAELRDQDGLPPAGTTPPPSTRPPKRLVSTPRASTAMPSPTSAAPR